MVVTHMSSVFYWFVISFILRLSVSISSSADDSSSSDELHEISVATWNSFDILQANDRENRRNYLFDNTDNLFSDFDILCTQEAFSPNAVNEFKEAFNFNYEFGSPDSELLSQSCSNDLISNMRNEDGLLYQCTQSCKNNLLINGVSWIFCVYLTCFSSLIDSNNDGITNRDINPDLYDLGYQLDLTACGGCLWESWYVENDLINNEGLTSDDALTKLLDRCESNPNGINYKTNAGIILHSQIEPKNIEYVEYPSIYFIPRGYIKAEFDDFTVICTHLEPPGTQLPFITFNDDLINNGVTYWDQVTELQTSILSSAINEMNNNKNVIVLGDHNMGKNEYDSIYNDYIDKTGLTHVFGDINDIDVSINPEYCTYSCENNVYANPNRGSEIIDHILFRGKKLTLKQDSAETFLTQLYEIEDGVYRQLSDHFGVRAVLQY